MENNNINPAVSEAATKSNPRNKHTEGEAIGTTDPRPPLTPAQVAERWKWHPESVRRTLRERRIGSIIIGRRRLVPASEIDRIENEGFISRAA